MASRNASPRNTSIAVIESEDDDPGIRGLSSYSQHCSGRPRLAVETPVGPRTAAPRPSVREAVYPELGPEPGSNRSASRNAHGGITPSSPSGTVRGLTPPSDPLNTAILSRSPGSPALALDQFVYGNTEVDSHEARGAMSKPEPSAAIASLRDFCLDDVESDASSSSSSGSSSSSESDMSPPRSPGVHKLQHARDGSTSTAPPSPLPIKQLIKQVCVAGLSGRNSAKFSIPVAQIRDICRAARSQFLSEPALLRLDGPLKIVGDVHGQFKDLMRLFKRGGMPPDTHYLFLGDYVDRGKQSLETICLLLLLKLRYPEHVHMLRGNHESAGITKVYGFYDECKRRSSLKTWRAFVDVFNTLPVAALVGGRIFCVHGGISPSLRSFAQIEALQRPTDVPDQGVLADLLWSDPDAQVKEWSENDRGVSFCFGQRSLTRFCRQLDVDLVVRGHMVVENGYEFFGGRRLVTVFSAPNYCGDFDNSAAVMNVSESLLCSFDVIDPRRHHSGETPPPTQHELSKRLVN